MESLPFEKRYSVKPIKLLDQYNREADNLSQVWKNSKGDPPICRNTMIDFIQKTHKKQGKLAPNVYWKPKKKGDYPDAKMMCQASLQSSRGPLYKISTAKIKGMVDTIRHTEKGKPGPGLYKDVERGKDYIQDRSGSYRGLCKSNMEQLLMMDDAKIRSKDRPMPGHYNPSYVSFKHFLYP